MIALTKSKSIDGFSRVEIANAVWGLRNEAIPFITQTELGQFIGVRDDYLARVLIGKIESANPFVDENQIKKIPEKFGCDDIAEMLNKHREGPSGKKPPHITSEPIDGFTREEIGDAVSILCRVHGINQGKVAARISSEECPVAQPTISEIKHSYPGVDVKIIRKLHQAFPNCDNLKDMVDQAAAYRSGTIDFSANRTHAKEVIDSRNAPQSPALGRGESTPPAQRPRKWAGTVSDN